MVHLKDWAVILGMVLIVFCFSFVMNALINFISRMLKIWRGGL